MRARKEYIESLAFCQYLDRFLPFVYQHNKLRFSREIRENPLAQTIDISLRLTPVSYQRLELYRILKDMRISNEGREWGTGAKERAVWYPACIVVKTEKNVEGVIRLLTEDLSPSIEFKIMVGGNERDEWMKGSRSIANWMRLCVQLDRHSRLYFETNRIIVCLLITTFFFFLQLLSIPTWIVTRIGLPNNLLMSSLAANSSWRRIFDTIRCCEGDWQRSSASRTNPPLSFFHPRCTTMSSYGISWFRKWNTFSRMISFACSSVIFNGCTAYLDREVDAIVSSDDAFKNFFNFQGYIEEMYNAIPDKQKAGGGTADHNFGEDEIQNVSWGDSKITNQFDLGNFRQWLNDNQTWLYNSKSNPTRLDGHNKVRLQALWQNAWYCIRKANLGLENLDKLVDELAKGKAMEKILRKQMPDDE